MELTFVFKMTDGKLSGVVRTPNGDTEITNAKVNAKEFSFDVSFNDMTIKHACILQEDDTLIRWLINASEKFFSDGSIPDPSTHK